MWKAVCCYGYTTVAFDNHKTVTVLGFMFWFLVKTKLKIDNSDQLKSLFGGIERYTLNYKFNEAKYNI